VDYKTPFSDAIESNPVPKRGSSGGKYDNSVAETIDVPGRDVSPNGVAELHRDTAVTTKSPSTSGPYKTLFKDAVD
jgi:hypothetical protein